MTKIDEQAHRRPDWQGEISVTLDDGQTWWLRKPRIRFTLIRDAAGTAELNRSVDAQGEYQEALDGLDAATVDIRSADDSDDTVGNRYVLAMLRLAHAVFRLNYEATDEEVNLLIPWYPNEPDQPVLKILEVAQGRTPKTTDDGGPAA